MSELPRHVEELATPFLRAGDLSECDRIFCRALQELPESPYHCALHLDFTNPPILMASHFDVFIAEVAPRFKIGLVRGICG